MSGLHAVFRRLEGRFGPQQWWPAETPFEVIIGAILTQNTAWTNVEQAIANLRAADVLTPAALVRRSPEELEQLIRPAGFFRQKAARLHHVATVLVDGYGGDVAALCAGPLDAARARLLALPGIGPETADSILLYAAHRPSFVVDAYTRRIFTRLGLLTGSERYEAIRDRFMAELPADVPLFNEYHALIVTLAKVCCRKRRPDCPACPLATDCRFARENRQKP
ncbi:MAG: endonuclease III domain-containing protein [Deltaproteobacteria bacterium]|nr:MAG: endonuclease III domain-containing protein [Deltaproteobacteria bacterium]